MTEAPKLSEFQSVAELRAALSGMPVVLHDVGPVEAWGSTTYLDIDVRDGTIRLSSSHDEEADRVRNEAGFTHCVKISEGTPGRRLAEALLVAEAEMPEIVEGFGDDDYGMSADLKTDQSYAALMRVREAVEAVR